MPKSLRLWTAAVAAIAALTAFALAADEGEEAKKPKHTIKEVMAKALAPKGDKLNRKVLSGEASDKEKLELLDLYVSLVENKAPMGDQTSWQKYAGTAALAAAKVAVGREGALDELKEATKCTGCHKAHRPKKED